MTKAKVTVKKGKKTVARNKSFYKAKKGTYKVTSTVSYFFPAHDVQGPATSVQGPPTRVQGPATTKTVPVLRVGHGLRDSAPSPVARSPTAPCRPSTIAATDDQDATVRGQAADHLHRQLHRQSIETLGYAHALRGPTTGPRPSSCSSRCP